MQSASAITIDLKKVAGQSAPLSFTLSDVFFQELDQEEIIGGDVEVTVRVKEQFDSCFVVRLAMEGTVTVACDRCLSDLRIPTAAEDEFKVYAGAETDTLNLGDNPDVRILGGYGYAYDLSWDIYELLALSLPLQRTHHIADCDPEMIRLMHPVEGTWDPADDDADGLPTP